MTKLYGQKRPLCCRAIDVTDANPEHVLALLYENAECPSTDVCSMQHRDGPLSPEECRSEVLDYPAERIEYINGRFMGRLDLFTGYLCARHWDEFYPKKSMWSILQNVPGCRLMMPVIRACAAACAPHRMTMKGWPMYGGNDARKTPRPPPWRQYADLMESGYVITPESERRPLTGKQREPLPELNF